MADHGTGCGERAAGSPGVASGCLWVTSPKP